MTLIPFLTEPLTLLATACGITTWLTQHQRRQRLAIVPVAPRLPELTTRFPSRAWGRQSAIAESLAETWPAFFDDGATVERFMSAPAVTANEHATRAQLAALMLERGIRHVPICSADGELLGLVSDRDLRTRPGDRAAEVMTVPPMTCVRTARLSEALNTLVENAIGCLPVLDQGRVCGVLTVPDALLVLHGILQRVEPPPEPDAEQAFEAGTNG